MIGKTRNLDARLTRYLQDHKESYARLLSVFLIIVFLNNVLMFYFINRYPEDTYSYRFWWDIVSLAVTLIPATILNKGFGDMYWYRTSPKTKLDEREARLRQEVFAISYKVTVGLIAFTLIIAPLILSNFKLSGSNLLYIPLIHLIIELYSLPTIIASWRHNTY